MNYEEYEIQCDKIRKENGKFLEMFHEDMVLEGLAEKTINKHYSNVDFYINTFLLREDAYSMHQGCGNNIDDFLGYFFIRKCGWSTRGTIKTMASSLKKFYKSMMVHGYVEAEDYNELCCIIKEEMTDWQELCDQYNDPFVESSFDIW